jgi:hypothetical protein
MIMGRVDLLRNACGRLVIRFGYRKRFSASAGWFKSHIPESFLKNISLQVVRNPLLWATLLYEE